MTLGSAQRIISCARIEHYQPHFITLYYHSNPSLYNPKGLSIWARLLWVPRTQMCCCDPHIPPLYTLRYCFKCALWPWISELLSKNTFFFTYGTIIIIETRFITNVPLDDFSTWILISWLLFSPPQDWKKKEKKQQCWQFLVMRSAYEYTQLKCMLHGLL